MSNSIAMKPLFIPLKTEFFEAFCNGSKNTEYRLYGPGWNEKTCAIGRPVIISKGYGKNAGRIIGFEVSEAMTYTGDWIKCYGEGKGPAACIMIFLDEVKP